LGIAAKANCRGGRGDESGENEAGTGALGRAAGAWAARLELKAALKTAASVKTRDLAARVLRRGLKKRTGIE
jgi:hypothetical protein